MSRKILFDEFLARVSSAFGEKMMRPDHRSFIHGGDLLAPWQSAWGVKVSSPGRATIS